MPSSWFRTLTLLVLSLSVVNGQKNICTKGQDGKKGGRCLRRQGPEYASAFCSSFLPITTDVVTRFRTVTATTTQRVTSYTGTTTETFSPPATTTISETATFDKTVTETSYNTVITGTITSFVATETTSAVSYSNLFTCPGDAPSSASSVSSSTSSSSRSSSSTLSFPTTSKNVTDSSGPTGSISGRPSSGTGISGTAPIGTGVSSSFTYSGSLPHYTWTRSTHSPSVSDPGPTLAPYITAPAAYGRFGLEKRQVFGNPPCLQKLNITSGLAGISSACNCLDIATPAPSTAYETVTDPSFTATETTVIRTLSTLTSTPTLTATQSVNDTLLTTRTVFSPTAAPTTVPATLTLTRTSISTIANPSPTPAEFNIFYRPNNNNSTARFFAAGPAPGGSGIVLSAERDASFFTVDPMGRLALSVNAAPSLLVTKNTEDLYPFLLLRGFAEDGNMLECSACGGRLRCDFPGTRGNVFAECFGFLSLGLPENFGADADGDGEGDCRVIELEFK